MAGGKPLPFYGLIGILLATSVQTEVADKKQNIAYYVQKYGLSSNEMSFLLSIDIVAKTIQLQKYHIFLMGVFSYYES